MKKNLLFVIESLDVAGAEKSLVTLLNLLDFNQYSVDLLLFAHGHVLEELVPNEVNILKPLRYTKFSEMNLSEAFLKSIVKSDYKMLLTRLKFSVDLRKKKFSNAQKARIYWQNASEIIEDIPKEYDVAISYAQGIPTFYVAEKVRAKKKLAWVNVSYRLDEVEKKYQRKYYDQYNQIVAVSDSAKEVFTETFPNYDQKIKILYDINNPAFVANMAGIGEHYEDNFNGIRILTIGRLAHQKGYDVALETCKKLKEEGIHFKWYAMGKGPLQTKLEQSIKDMGLTEHFILLGVKPNPYPYIKNTDIYVQTSRFEGFGLAIAEARMLNVPVVTSKFDAVYNQMIDGKNGLVVERNATAVAEAIKKLIYDHDLRQSVVDFLQKEKKGNIEDINKFYQLIESHTEVANE